MDISYKQILVLYFAALCLFSVYTLTSIQDCEAYWMHDASISITKQKLLIDASILFLLPLLIVVVRTILKIEVPTGLFMKQFVIALTSISLLVLAINKPCESINNGHYMFISSALALAYYVLKWTSFIIISKILFRTIFNKEAIHKMS